MCFTSHLSPYIPDPDGCGILVCISVGAVLTRKNAPQRKAGHMEMPNYDGIIEKWKIKLIMQRAKLHGFKKSELPDVLQDIVLELMKFKYSPKLINPASERTIITTVIDNMLFKIIRTNYRYRLHVQRAGLLGSIFSVEEVKPQCIDIQDAVKMLSPRNQQISNALAMGMSREQIANTLGCSWRTVNKSCKCIRRHFKKLGLERWISE